MRRRDLLKGAAAATFTAGVAPRLGWGADRAKTLVFVGVADLSVLDPVMTGFRPTRNAAYLVFDTLYGIDTEWKAQPQMVEGHVVAEDGLTWTLTLRQGLRFHDGEPVLARDVVASIRRFAQRVIFANALMDATEELSATDDRTRGSASLSVRRRKVLSFTHTPRRLKMGSSAEARIVRNASAPGRCSRTVSTASRAPSAYRAGPLNRPLGG
jgi:hypothetical protein